jgi:hypothetical protein
MKKILLLFTLITTTSFGQNNSNCACCDEHHDQFDFWVGDWIVYDTAGTEIGKNTIVELQDNCVLQESWRSTNSTGTSYNYFNRSDSTWNQLWVDNSGSQLELKGSAIENGMVMSSDWTTSAKGTEYRNQIIWKKQPDGSVTQTWNIVDRDNQIVNVLFHGIYRRN